MILKKSLLFGIGLTVCAGASAHQSVSNPAVKARMDAMVGINSAMKTLDHMAKGASQFDPAVAQSAASKITRLAKKTPDLFRQRQDDPKSEALLAIWDNFEDFTQKSADMEQAAGKAAGQLADVAALKASLVEIGVTCKACHSDYRK